MFDNRALVVPPSEMSHWKQLSIDFMSEESDDGHNNFDVVLILPIYVIILYVITDFRLSWLDVRYEETVPKEGAKLAKKSRKVGTPSSVSPPVNAPDWTLDKSLPH